MKQINGLLKQKKTKFKQVKHLRTDNHFFFLKTTDEKGNIKRGRRGSRFFYVLSYLGFNFILRFSVLSNSSLLLSFIF